MNYKESLRYLNSFINYEKTPPKSHAELNLTRMRHGLEALRHPEKKFFPILIAGTVGKGSTGFFLEQILLHSKISCGFYHSPHVDHVRERVRVNGKMLSEKKWAQAVSEIKKLLVRSPFPKKMGQPTYFELLTLLAIWVFARQKIKIGVFEVGMGGRLDATNVLDAPLCLITKIDLDHQAFLGNTPAKIAREKAGIIKKAKITVCSPQIPEALREIRRAVRVQKSKLVLSKSAGSALEGGFQKQNAGNAAVAARALRQFRFSISEQNIRRGLLQKKWPGRFEFLKWKDKTILTDAAHNPAGCRALVDALKASKIKPGCILFSSLRDKDTAAMLNILSELSVPVIVVPLKHARAKKLADLAAEAEAFFDKIIPAKDTRQGLRILNKLTGPAKAALVTGSFYLISEVRKKLRAE